MAAPNKAEREKCWSSKDAFWNCMEKNNDNAVACAELRKVYEASCTKQWVKYFDRRREYLKFKENVEKGYDLIDEKDQKL